MKALDLSIIIVNFNTKDVTIACLESIIENTHGVSYEVIVVDNASVDGSVKEIANRKSQIANFTLIENKKNIGFSRANNIGVKHASGRYVLFLNSDTVVPKKTLERMVRFMDEHEDVGAATCFVRLPNGKLDDAAHRGFPTPWNAFCHFSGLAKLFPHSLFLNGYHLGWKDLQKTHEIDAQAGAFMVVRRKAGDEVGWWDEDYFFYGEDLDFCYELKQKGWKIYFVPDVEILHYKGVSGGIKEESQTMTTADSKTKRLATNQRFEAMKIFYTKHYLNKYPKLVTGLVLFVIDMKLNSALKNL